jgi:heptosyltransferase-1
MWLRRSIPPLDALNPRRICIVKPSALGDVIQSLPVLAALRSRWPESQIAWVVKDCFADLLTDHPELDEVIPFDGQARGRRFLVELLRIGRLLRTRNYDLAIDLQGLLRSGAMVRATGAPRRVGFSCGREGSTWCYTDILPVNDADESVLLRYWKVAQALGVQSEIPPVRLGLNTTHEEFAARQLESLPRPILAIHPSAGWATKRWPEHHFLRIAHLAREHYQAGIVIVGGRDAMPAGRLIADSGIAPVVDLTGRTTLRQLAAVVSRVDAMLSGDSGPMHLAAAMGTRVVSLFTCTNTIRHAPFGQEQRVVATRVPCAASHRKVCPVMDCMRELLPARVWPTLSAALLEAQEAAKQAPAKVA